MLSSITRTLVPLLVSWIVAAAAWLNIDVAEGQRELIATGVGSLVALAYYTLIRALEKRWPALSVFLGSTQQPSYSTASPVALPLTSDETAEPAPTSHAVTDGGSLPLTTPDPSEVAQ